MISDVFYSMEGTAKVVVDSAFKEEVQPSLVKSFTNNTRCNGELRQPHKLNNDATSGRQIIYEERGGWKIMLNFMVLLYNFRAAKVGQNQIQLVFMSFLSCNTLEHQL